LERFTGRQKGIWNLARAKTMARKEENEIQKRKRRRRCVI